MKKFLTISRWFLVTIGIILLTSFTIDATTSFNVSQSALGIFAREVTTGRCPSGMSEYYMDNVPLCIDLFEVSAGENCDVLDPMHNGQTTQNINDGDCQPVSVEKRRPWVNVTVSQARELCAKAGKRLPNAHEWYQAALGTPDDISDQKCNIDTSRAEISGLYASCVSGIGAYDMIGNVWEWVDDEIVNNTFNGRNLPNTGYVQSSDKIGFATETGVDPSETYYEDYFWSDSEGVYAVMRGGFYSSKNDAGIYSVHADIDTNFSGSAVGFRCVTNL